MARRPIRPGIRSAAGDPVPEEEQRSERLREALSSWVTGVAVLAVSDGEEIDAITVSAFSPVSLDPPLVLACVGEHSSTLPMLLEVRRFTVNLLPEDARRIAILAAGRHPLGELPFATEGDPVLDGVLASFVCRLQDVHPGGDHLIVVGEVERVALGRDAKPLVYYRREYRALR